jgi:hypothetical protein
MRVTVSEGVMILGSDILFLRIHSPCETYGLSADGPEPL